MKLIVRLSVGLVVAAAVVSAHESRSAEIVSHRAEYRFYLGGSETRAGGSVEENRVECDAWVQSSRHRMHGSNLRPGRQRLETKEYRDGHAMTFLQHVSSGGERVLSFEGIVRQGRNGKPAIASFTSPREMEVPLPRGTVFSTAFYLRTIREFRTAPGKTIRRTPVFGLMGRSGSLFYVEARRVKTGEPLFTKVEGDTELLDSPSIDIELRLFASRQAAKPVQRIVATVHANGVYSRAVYYQPRATLIAEIVRIQALPKAKC